MFFHNHNNRKAGIYKMPDISVLIIDDEPSILKAVSMTLKQEHIAVTCADNGTLALDILKANTFDFNLTGYHYAGSGRVFHFKGDPQQSELHSGHPLKWTW